MARAQYSAGQNIMPYWTSPGGPMGHRSDIVAREAALQSWLDKYARVPSQADQFREMSQAQREAWGLGGQMRLEQFNERNRQSTAEQARQLELMRVAQEGDLRAAVELEQLRQSGQLVLAEGGWGLQRELAEGGWGLQRELAEMNNLSTAQGRAWESAERARDREYQTEADRRSGGGGGWGGGSSGWAAMAADRSREDSQAHALEMQERAARNALIGSGLLAYNGADEFGDTVRALDADERRALRDGTLPTHLREDLARDVRENRRALQRNLGGVRGMRGGTIAGALAESSGSRRDSELASRVRQAWRDDAKRIQEARATNTRLGR